MNLIAAVDKNWAIGNENNLLFNIKEDMKFFRETTTGKVVVMGRKTLESFPNQKPLKNRINIVLTKNPDYKADGAIIVNDTDALFCELEKYEDDDIFVIGGAAVYNILIPYCKYAYITEIDDKAENADAFITDISSLPMWSLETRSEKKEDNGTFFTFNKYVNKKFLND